MLSRDQGCFAFKSQVWQEEWRESEQRLMGVSETKGIK